MKLLTVTEAAQALRLNPWTVYQMVRDGKLPAIRFGRSIRFDQAQLERKVLGEPAPVPLPVA